MKFLSSIVANVLKWALARFAWFMGGKLHERAKTSERVLDDVQRVKEARATVSACGTGSVVSRDFCIHYIPVPTDDATPERVQRPIDDNNIAYETLCK